MHSLKTHDAPPPSSKTTTPPAPDARLTDPAAASRPKHPGRTRPHPPTSAKSASTSSTNQSKDAGTRPARGHRRNVCSLHVGMIDAASAVVVGFRLELP